MSRFVTLGETMVVFDPLSNGPLRYVDQFKKRFAGAESNVAIGMQKLGINSSWISKLGDDEFGHYLIQAIRGEGVDTKGIVQCSEAPTGVFFKEKRRVNQQEVLYYRHGSAASQMTAEDIDWQMIKEADYLHLTGITPFLSASCQELIFELLKTASDENVTISFDPNLRFKLLEKWPDHKEILQKIIRHVDILLPGFKEASYIYGIENDKDLISKLKSEGVRTGFIKNEDKTVFYYNETEEGLLSGKQLQETLDPIGAGDGFAAGVLSALMEGKSIREAASRGALIGAMTVTTEGDIEGLPTMKELQAFASCVNDVVR